jgi:hypothetical protein
VLAAWPATGGAAQGGPSNAGALFLEFPVGARAVGMGQTGVADGGSGEAAFWNPAGLADLGAARFELHTVALAAGRTHAVTAFVPNSRIGVFGGAVYLVDYGDLERTDSSSTVIAKISPRNFEFIASFATALPGPVTVGINYKLISLQVDCSGDCAGLPNGEGVTHALDLGGQFAVGGEGALTIGVALRSLGFDLQVENRDQADPLPTRLALGALWRTPLGSAGAGERFDLRVAADVDRPWGQDGDPALRLGFDVGYREVARVRAGYGQRTTGESSASVGLGVATGGIGVDLAQTFLSTSELEAANPTFFSFRISF